LLVGACSGDDRGFGVLDVPEVGGVEPGSLRDGHPVFVVHHPDGSIHVVEAISAHLEDDTMAWCPSSRTIDDVPHGSRWDAKGRYVSGPSPTDLGTYRIDVASDGETVVVLAYVEPAPRSTISDGVAGPTCIDGGYEIHPAYDG
jgi:Rieske Fe-S protein